MPTIRLLAIALLSLTLSLACRDRGPAQESKPIDPNDRTRFQPKYQQDRGGHAPRPRSRPGRS